MALWLDLEITDFSHLQGNNFGLNLLAFATSDRRPLKGSEIQFFAGGDPINEAVKTDKNGRAPKKEAVIEIGPGAKKILIEAQIIGTDKRVKKPFPVPWPEKETKEKSKPPAKIIPHESGSAGKHKITFQVLAQDDSPVPKAKIRICDPTGRRDLKPTDKNGIAVFEINFTESEKVLEAHVLGSSVSTWVNLFN